ncbi:ATPase [Siphonobacter sp. BAB-5385]|nr:ATPase [Siphonobacter sp. BAB-5385]
MIRDAARKEKAGLINRINYNQQISRPIEYPTFTAETYHAWLLKKTRELGTPLVVTDHNWEIIQALAMYFTRDPRAEAFGLDLNKGLLIHGKVGRGKTYILKAFRTNPSASFLVVPCSEISDHYTQDGADALDKYSSLAKGVPSPFNGDTSYGFCYDDLGTEETASSYGNKRNVMAEIIQRVYNRTEMKGRVHLTTNLTSKQIEEMYGLRIRSRLREMFNIIKFPSEAPDMRK